MPLLIPDNRRMLLLAVLVTALLAFMLQAGAASVSNERIVWDALDGFEGNLFEAVTMKQPRVRQGSTLLRAEKGNASFTNGDGEADNSTWKFTGDVHVEVDGAVLDAEAATVVFVNRRVSSVVVQSATTQPAKKSVHLEYNNAVLDVDTATLSFADGRINTIQALGKPAQFSHVLKKNGRRVNGRANKIEYDARKSLASLSVDAWFSNGVSELATQLVTYNLADGLISSPGKSTGTYQAEERVPAPHTPDRATAK
jgi:lipopolysaccharide transport protein LptA